MAEVHALGWPYVVQCDVLDDEKPWTLESLAEEARKEAEWVGRERVLPKKKDTEFIGHYRREVQLGTTNIVIQHWIDRTRNG